MDKSACGSLPIEHGDFVRELAEVPPRVEYALTPLGESLLGAASALVQWAADNYVEIRDHRELTQRA
ncbi:winged helix-turn-helix transcriptional regulator [Cryptosporangium sp. NPDC048952]|uniref:winged helix-turn-helix transcriptional regulator n=1 Tax=Cryptosporangium sp. NPDC048952 TaxID=3363961 RepID=UPI003717AA51